MLLELLELLLVELFRAALTLSSNSCLRQGISFFHVALVECPLLLLYYVKAILIGRGPWPWNAGACLRGACAELARGLRENTALFSEKGRQPDFSFNSYGPCTGLAGCLRLGADLPNPGGAPPLNEEVKAYNAAKMKRLSKFSY